MTDPALHPQPKARRRDIVERSLQCRCPNCGQAKLFKDLVHIHHRCPYCAMTLERGDGYFLGPLCINYGLVVFGFVAPVLLIGIAGWIPIKWALMMALAGAIALPIMLYRLCWGLWLLAYYVCLPDELHANRPEDSDDLKFEEEARR